MRDKSTVNVCVRFNTVNKRCVFKGFDENEVPQALMRTFLIVHLFGKRKRYYILALCPAWACNQYIHANTERIRKL